MEQRPADAEPPRGWSDRAFAWKNRILASRRFRRWASAFPLTRPIARRRARALFDLCAGFVYAQVLTACVRLRLFDLLRETPMSAAEISRRLALPLDSTRTLLNAAVALRLVGRRRGDRYGLGPLGAAMIGNDGVAAMVEHHALFYGDLADPVALLRSRRSRTGLRDYWPYARSAAPADLDGEQVAPYTALMAASQAMVAEEVLDAYPLARHRRLLDVGGGDGTFLAAAAERAPDLELVLFDLPAVVACAARRLEAAGLAGRSTVVGGDFLANQLPAGADVASLVRIVHDHDDAAALAILRGVHRALGPGGVVLVAEPMAGTRGAAPVGDAYFGFYLLAMGSGRPRTPAEIRQLLTAAGFTGCRDVRTRTPIVTQIVVAEVPG